MNKFTVLLVVHVSISSEAVRFIYQPMDRSAEEGKWAHLTCIFRDITNDMEGKYDVIWTKDSYIISELSNGFDLDRFSFHNRYADRRHLLRIDPVKREDGGGYKCHLRYNGEVLLTSNIAILTILEIPSKEYPLVNLEKSTYKIGEEVKVRCLCEKTNPIPNPELRLPSEKGLLGLTTGENDTHVWIEATISATLELNGVKFECKLTIEGEIAPRYSIGERLYIDNGSELLKTTPREPDRQTHKQQTPTRFLPPVELSDPQTENDETSATGGTRPVAYSLGIAVILTMIVI